jgi:oxalate decarboxylase/phosphoglucose isomerase-like protein (cupin superfamily)
VKHAGFQITGCWANLSPKGTVHPRHCHPNNFLSGVYYVAVADGADTISFDDPRPHWTVIAPELRDQRPELSNTVVMTVQPGTLIIFPSWLVHFVEANTSAITRVSVSFNVMFSSFAETISKTQWTATLPLPVSMGNPAGVPQPPPQVAPDSSSLLAGSAADSELTSRARRAPRAG